MKQFLMTHSILFNEWPVESHYKKGIIKKEHQDVGIILKGIQLEVYVAFDNLLLSKTAILSNLFYGSGVLSSFDLVYGYSTEIFTAGSRVVSHDVIEVCKDRECLYVSQNILKLKSLKLPGLSNFHCCTHVHYFYKSLKHTKSIELHLGTVVSAEDFIVIILNEKSIPSSVAYEDLRILPRPNITEDLLVGAVLQFTGGNLEMYEIHRQRPEDEVENAYAIVAAKTDNMSVAPVSIEND